MSNFELGTSCKLAPAGAKGIMNFESWDGCDKWDKWDKWDE